MSLRTTIIDVGSENARAGYSGDFTPTSFFPSVFGKKSFSDMTPIDTAIGYKALSLSNGVHNWELQHPIHHGNIINWDILEHLLYFICRHELTEESESILLTDSPTSSKADRERSLQTLFEVFSFKYLYIANQAVMTLFGSGNKSGMVLECGGGASHVVPIIEGRVLTDAVKSSEIGGLNLTDYLERKLNEKGVVSNCSKMEGFRVKEIARDIKEKKCHVSVDFENDRKSENQVSYELPDGKTIMIGNELFECPEILFEPSLIGLTCEGIHKEIISAFDKSGEEFRSELYRNIVMGGGSTLFKGFSARIKKELQVDSTITDISIDETYNGPFSSWIGGSMFALSSQFQSLSISFDEYEENGPCIVHRFLQ